MFTNLLRYPKNFIEINSKYSSGVINVRYEDIVTDTHATLERIFTDLDISTDKDHIEKIIAQGFAEDENVLNHRTTDDDVTTSVGRWKRNADSEMVAFFDRFYGQLQEAGYE